MARLKIAFETQSCTRCAGSGTYSRCQTWGTTCFKCGTRPGSPGSGLQLSRRAKKARQAFEAAKREQFGVSLADVKPGDWVRIEQLHITNNGTPYTYSAMAQAVSVHDEKASEVFGDVDAFFSGCSIGGGEMRYNRVRRVLTLQRGSKRLQEVWPLDMEGSTVPRGLRACSDDEWNTFVKQFEGRAGVTISEKDAEEQERAEE